MSNDPVIAGTRIRTAAVWSFHEDGFTVEQILQEYPSLSPEEVQAATNYEREKRKQKETEAFMAWRKKRASGPGKKK